MVSTPVVTKFARIADAVVAGDEAAIEELTDLVGHTAASGDLAATSRLRLDLTRLGTASEREGTAADVRVKVETLRDALVAAERNSVGDAVAVARAAYDVILREHLVELLRERSTARPSELAAAADVDIHQVSRALGELRNAGLIEDAPTPVAGDKRGRWYQLAQASAHDEVESLVNDLRGVEDDDVAYVVIAVKRRNAAVLGHAGRVRVFGAGGDEFEAVQAGLFLHEAQRALEQSEATSRG